MVVRTVGSAFGTGLLRLTGAIIRAGRVFDPVAAALLRFTLWAAGRLGEDTFAYEAPGSLREWLSTGGDWLSLAVHPEQDTTIDDTYRVVGMLELGTVAVPIVYLLGVMNVVSEGVEAAFGGIPAIVCTIAFVVAILRVAEIHLSHVTVEVVEP